MRDIKCKWEKVDNKRGITRKKSGRNRERMQVILTVRWMYGRKI